MTFSINGGIEQWQLACEFPEIEIADNSAAAPQSMA
jgi:hypothetical protein